MNFDEKKKVQLYCCFELSLFRVVHLFKGVDIKFVNNDKVKNF